MRIGLWLLSGFLGLVVLAFFFIGFYPMKVPTFAETQKSYKPSDILVLDRNNYPLDLIRVNDHQRSLAWTPWVNVSASFQKLLIQTEDKRFFQHHGVDVLALLNSVRQSAFFLRRRGASTLTMQLATLLTSSSRNSQIFKNLARKFEQLMMARQIEKSWSKEEILEAYINLVSFRGELVGLNAASFGYFNKSPSALSETESATLIALLRAPNAQPKRVAERVCQILPDQNCAQMKNIVIESLSKDYHISRSMDHLQVMSPLIFENQIWPKNQMSLKTTLDIRIQDYALQILREQMQELKNKNVNEGAILVLDTATGKTLAYVANPGAKFSAFSQVDGILARRQVGSTLKAFIYAAAFDLNFLNLNSTVEDSRADISIGGGRVYHPRNYDHIFHGYVTAGEALASSLNVPAVRTLALVGERRILDILQKLGFKNLEDEDYYGPSLALGSLDASLWEMTQGYRQISQSNIFSKNAKEQIFNALAAPEYRRLTFGMDNVLNLPFAAAVKTGTSKDMRDNWCIGWTSQYTIGVWVGNFNGEPMWNVSGVTGAAPIWRSLMLALHPNATPLPQIHFESASKIVGQKTMSRIRYPVEDMRIGIDPDIPNRQQKLPIEIENPQPHQQVYLNGVRLGFSKSTLLWSLKKGKQRLALKTVSGRVIDEINFEVR